jgi:retron-type reverse transcriptase
VNKLTRADLANSEKIAEVVGDKCDKRWHRGRLDTAGIDGMTRLDFFVTPEDLRIKMVLDFILRGTPGQLKGHEVRKPGGGCRVIASEMTVEHAAGYVLYDALEPIIRALLTKNCQLYVPGRVMRDDITDTIRIARSPQYTVVVTPDIHHFFDELSWKHLRRKLRELPLADDLVEFIMATAKAEIVTERGRILRRDKGIGQGLVIAPLLANLYLAGTDERASRRLGRIGVLYTRASDNFILPCPTVEVAQEALAILEEELQLARLKIKPETKTVHDLENKFNAPVWLGIKFTRKEAWVPAKVIEKKAQEYQRDIDRGLLEQKGLEERLEHLERYYEHLVGSDSARRAKRAIYSRVNTTFAPGGKKGGHQQVRRQVQRSISKDDFRTGRGSSPPPAGCARQGEPDHRDGSRDERPTSIIGMPPRQEPDGPGQEANAGTTVATEIPPCPSSRNTQPDPPSQVAIPSPQEAGMSSLPLQGQEACSSWKGEGETPIVTEEGETITGSSSSGATTTETLLASPNGGKSQPEDDPAKQQYRHRLHRAQKTIERTRAMLDHGWRIYARAVSTAVVEIRARPIIGPEVIGYIIPVEANSKTAAEVEAITIALERLHRERGVRYAEVRVTDPTLVGFFDQNWHVRSPAVGRRLRELLRVVDDLFGGRVEFVTGSSRWAFSHQETGP